MNNNNHVNLNEIEMNDKSLPDPKQIEVDKTNQKIDIQHNSSGVKDQNVDISDAENANNQEEQAEKFKIPSNLKRTFICSICLFLVGVTFIIIGFIEQVRAADPGNGITFWILGSIIFIPGAYYSYLFYKAKKNHDNHRNDDILSEIPEL